MNLAHILTLPDFLLLPSHLFLGLSSGLLFEDLTDRLG
jgi:hypothetical protein